MKSRIWYFSFLIIAILATGTLAESPEDGSTCKSSSDENECKNENEKSSDSGNGDGDGPKEGIRIVTREELERKTGEDGSEIWLSVMGEVYDVTAGKSFYGKGKSYGAFSGTDCTVCFVSGLFTADEAAKHTDEISDAMIPGVLDWTGFYATHRSYNFVGYLVDPRFYDEKGEPTTNLIDLKKRIASIQK